MKIREWLFNFFHFNKQERNGVFILCVIIAVLFLIKLLIPVLAGDKSEVQFITVDVKKGDDERSSNGAQAESLSERKISTKDANQELFVFNPNTISANDAQRLGFSVKLSRTLINFRNKGGKFCKTEDLKKLYGMPQSLYQTLEAYVLIPTTNKDRDSVKQVVSKGLIIHKKEVKPLLDLNTADSLSIVELRGVGPAFTKRILKYRKLLGGFHSLVQLKEVYGMNDSLYTTISSQSIVNTDNFTKIPINAIDISSLRSHPYFTYQMASAIINYRNKHGKLTEKIIKDLGIFNEEKLNKILPYLSYQ